MLHLVNLPREICQLAIGKDHSTTHRCIAGVVVMTIGVSVAKAANLTDIHFFHFAFDIVGYGIHGMGLVPFIELLLESGE